MTYNENLELATLTYKSVSAASSSPRIRDRYIRKGDVIYRQIYIGAMGLDKSQSIKYHLGKDSVIAKSERKIFASPWGASKSSYNFEFYDYSFPGNTNLPLMGKSWHYKSGSPQTIVEIKYSNSNMIWRKGSNWHLADNVYYDRVNDTNIDLCQILHRDNPSFSVDLYHMSLTEYASIRSKNLLKTYFEGRTSYEYKYYYDDNDNIVSVETYLIDKDKKKSLDGRMEIEYLY